MGKTATTRYDAAEHLRTPDEMAAYLEACLEEARGDAAFIATETQGVRGQVMEGGARVWYNKQRPAPLGLATPVAALLDTRRPGP